ncbi:hypothetical protein CROQUDRAFT_650735 [Cronartium quercuum f. sp. fusiforme G11]|uniref:Wax synthase domain-containing protein n=1 Tax=Cronartium quercuum f. sp. fusiforme G11 TaxID=708437 RepID=A0A9P6NTJ5_9BASI|nr:hypothetical protein CROQUDRAFT_650735 [Cronartium quercuum f. sp. fusiforme G11]
MSTQLGLPIPAGTFLFTVPLVLQIFLRHPFYNSNQPARVLRMALMPITIYLTLSSQPARMWEPREEFLHINFALVSFLTVHVVCLAIQLGLSNSPPLYTQNLKDQISQEHEMSSKAHQKISSTPKSESPPSWGESIKFIIWFLFSPRFVKTTWASPTAIVPLGPKLCLQDFFIKTLKKSLRDHLLFLACWIVATTLTKYPSGSYRFLIEKCGFHESFLLKSLAPYLNALPHAFSTWLVLEVQCNIVTMIELGFYYIGPKLLPQSISPGPFDSTLYSPLFPDLWGQSSIGAFWSKGWHSVFRRHIMFCVASPIARLCDPLGKFMSTQIGNLFAMIFSSLFHEYILISIAPSGDPTYSTSKVWLYSALAIVLESIFKMVTGKKVGGLIGKIWTYSFILILTTQAITKW